MSKVAIIPRGGSGLGQSTGVRLAKEGVHIVGIYLSGAFYGLRWMAEVMVKNGGGSIIKFAAG